MRRGHRHTHRARWGLLLAAALFVATLVATSGADPARAQRDKPAADKLGEIVQQFVDGKIDFEACGEAVEPLLDQLNASVPGADWDDGEDACGDVIVGWVSEGRLAIERCDQLLAGTGYLDTSGPGSVLPGDSYTCQDMVDSQTPPEGGPARGDILGPFKFTTSWALWLTDPRTPSYLFENFDQNPGDAGNFGESFGQDVSLMSGFQGAALALLGVILTFTVIQYWASGFVSSGGMEIATAPLRVAGAGLFIIAWPDIVDVITHLETVTWSWLVGCQTGPGCGGGADMGNVEGALKALEGALLIEQPVNDFIGGATGEFVDFIQLDALIAFLFGLAIAITTIALSVAKLMITFGQSVLFLAMFILAALWPLQFMGWIAPPALRAGVALSVVPLGWTVSLVGFSQISGKFEEAAAPGTFHESWTRPLIGIMLLLFLFVAMRQILRWGGIVPGSSRPLTAAWGAVMGLAYMGGRVAWGGARAGMRTVRNGWGSGRAGSARPGAAGGGWTQQDPSSAAGQTARHDRHRPSDRGRIQDPEAARSAAHTQQHRMDQVAEDRTNRGRITDPERAHGAAQEQQQRMDQAAQERIDRGRIQDPERAERAAYDQKSRMDEQATRWQPAPGANADADGLASPYKDRIDAERRASDSRFRADGGPEVDKVENAWYSLSAEERRGLQDQVWGVPDERNPNPAPEHMLAEAAATDGIAPEKREAYRTLLDAVQHNEVAFENVTVEPPDRGQQ